MKLTRKSVAFVTLFVAIPMVIGVYFGAKALPFVFAVGAFAAFLPHPWPMFSDASPEEVARMPRLSLPARALHFCFFMGLAAANWFEQGLR